MHPDGIQTTDDDLPLRRTIEGRILRAIVEERRHQEEKWGIQSHTNYKWMSILMEEVGEAAKEVNDLYVRESQNYDGDVLLKEHYNRLQEELIQVCAVAVAHLEDIEYFLQEQGLVEKS